MYEISDALGVLWGSVTCYLYARFCTRVSDLNAGKVTVMPTPIYRVTSMDPLACSTKRQVCFSVGMSSMSVDCSVNSSV